MIPLHMSSKREGEPQRRYFTPLSPEAEALRALRDGQQQLLAADLPAGVLRDVELVEARVRGGEAVRAPALDDSDPLQAVHAFERLEPTQGDLGRPGDALGKKKGRKGVLGVLMR